MNSAPESIAQRLERIRERIRGAEERAGRRPGTVTLVAAVKTVPAAAVARALELGVRDLGENRVQEARATVAVLGRGSARWHMIGHLQRNKAGAALELFDRVHSVDGGPLAEALSQRARAAGRTLPVLIEVNVSGEVTKHGVPPAEARALAEAVAELPGLALDGLMTVGPAAADPAAARACCARLRELRDALERALGRPLPELSMGMSGDFEEAILEGSTMVRIGTALFGPRG